MGGEIMFKMSKSRFVGWVVVIIVSVAAGWFGGHSHPEDIGSTPTFRFFLSFIFSAIFFVIGLGFVYWDKLGD
jgi:hypothetical protein